MTDSGDLVLDGTPSGETPREPYTCVRCGAPNRTADLLRMEVATLRERLSALPREEPQPAPSEAAKALESLEEWVGQLSRRGAIINVEGLIAGTNFEVLRRALSGLPQPTEHDLRITELHTKLQAADVVMAAIDVATRQKWLGERSTIADARLDYGDPWKYEYALPKQLARFGSPPSPTSKEG